MSTPPEGITLVEYSNIDSSSESKHEYYRGEVFAMAGGSPQHSLIAANFTGEVRQILKGKPCHAYNSDLRVKVVSSGLYTYPDASVVCGELEFDQDISNTVLNPTVIVEVLSESTERYDRGTKSAHYRTIASLKELVLIDQYSVRVECLTRQSDGQWLLRESTQLSHKLVLSSIQTEIPLVEIYRGVVFPVESTPTLPI